MSIGKLSMDLGDAKVAEWGRRLLIIDDGLHIPNGKIDILNSALN